jgi:hypothetical protein
MITVKEGQCGVCTHFGTSDTKQEVIVQIRTNKEAPVDLVEPCGHPQHQPLDLMVNAISTCNGFTPVQ